jgi:predicted acylesterase/phospholipase RssA
MRSAIQHTNKPLGTIALCLSGGGARAAGYHMGTLAYLVRLDLLKDVEILSSASGGSFVAAKYAMTLKRAAEGEPLDDTFARFYREFYQFLIHANLVPRAIEKLSQPARTKSGRRDFITALADVYNEDERFLDHCRFDEFWKGREIHLKDIIINATEFKTGLGFRFQKSRNAEHCGSVKVKVSDHFVRKARLADIVAASSCIPVGMEPLVFPDDFQWPENEPKANEEIADELEANCRARSIVLMDGGVYDNQGMESATMACHGDVMRDEIGDSEYITNRMITRWRYAQIAVEDDRLGTMIISDTPSVSDTIYGPTPVPKPSRVTIGTLNTLSIVLITVCVLSLAANAYHFFQELEERNLSTVEMARFLWRIEQIDDLLNYIVPAILAGGVALLLLYLRHKAKEFGKVIPAKDVWKSVKKIKVSQLTDMVSLRLSSTWAMTVDVYFNRIRALGYSFLLADPGLQKKVITHEIYDLALPENPKSKFRPSAAMLAPARRAMAMPTKIWFDQESELTDLIAAGMSTMCFNLLEYIDGKRKQDPGYADAIYQQALSDWKKLSDDPFVFVREMNAEMSKAAPETPPAARAAAQHA